MPKFVVTITETLVLNKIIEAEDTYEAERIAEDAYDNEQIVLYPESCDGVDFDVHLAEEEEIEKFEKFDPEEENE